MTKKQFHELVSRSAVGCSVTHNDMYVALNGKWNEGYTSSIKVYRLNRYPVLSRPERLTKISNQAAKYKKWLEEVTNQ